MDDATKPALDGATIDRGVLRVRNGSTTETADVVVGEAPLEIRLGDTALAVIMRTPGADEELIRGFALTEGIAIRPDEIVAILRLGPHPSGSRYRLQLADGVNVDPERFRRNLYATSSCGVCGKASIDAVRVAVGKLPPGPNVDHAVIAGLPGAMRARQTTFAATGGLHAAAVFDPEGTILAVAEDVGRHNAVDKVIGGLSSVSWPLRDRGLVVSGRISFEIAQKAGVAGIALVAGVSAPSSLALELADDLDMTIVGFVRDGGFNIYTAPERILLAG